MQTDQEISNFIRALKSPSTVAVKYTVRDYSTFQQSIEFDVNRINGDMVYGFAYSAEYGRTEVFLRVAHGQNMIRVGSGKWRIISSIDWPDAK